MIKDTDKYILSIKDRSQINLSIVEAEIRYGLAKLPSLRLIDRNKSLKIEKKRK